ncbi:MAG: FapA family protein [bacterium]|nr:FapA family protein [bacterium]
MEQSQQEQKKKKKKEDIEIEISPDNMKAFLQINSLGKEGSLTDVNIIMHKLWNASVVHGIKGEVISQIIEQKILGEPIVVAEGSPPVNGDDAIIEYRFTKALKPRLLTDLAGRVDYRDLGLIENVKSGETLATKRAATKGSAGITVTGKQVSARDGSDIPIPAGQNTEIIENGTAVISTANGYITWKESKIGVDTIYRVKGDVNMNVGNIHFIGTVEIDGDVREGFRVISGENVIINGGIENATIRAEKNIEVKYGIRGKRGYIYAKGDLKSKFIENTTVEVKGDVIVSDSIIHSNVDAGGNVIVLEGKKGVIIGGRIRAGGEVNAKNIGSISEILTEIEVGIDPSLRQELLALEEMVKIEREELREVKLKSNILTAQGKKDEAFICLKECRELEESLKSGIEALNQIKKHIAANPAGKVSVVEQVYPGVSLTIRMKTLLLKIDYKKITFVEKLGEIENLDYKEPTIKSKEDKGKKLAYWEREIKVKN